MLKCTWTVFWNRHNLDHKINKLGLGCFCILAVVIYLGQACSIFEVQRGIFCLLSYYTSQFESANDDLTKWFFSLPPFWLPQSSGLQHPSLLRLDQRRQVWILSGDGWSWSHWDAIENWLAFGDRNPQAWNGRHPSISGSSRPTYGIVPPTPSVKASAMLESGLRCMREQSLGLSFMLQSKWLV